MDRGVSLVTWLVSIVNINRLLRRAMEFVHLLGNALWLRIVRKL